MTQQNFSVWTTSVHNLFLGLLKEFSSPPIILCLGEPLQIGDCLGPMVGTLLRQKGYKNYVYGFLDAKICASNLGISQKFIKSLHPSQKLLVIDASTSKHPERLGQIVLKKNYEPFNPVLKGQDIKADYFLFGVSSLCKTFPQMFCEKKLLTQKLAILISNSLLLL